MALRAGCGRFIIWPRRAPGVRSVVIPCAAVRRRGSLPRRRFSPPSQRSQPCPLSR
jgi:hypothetical protein